MAKSGQTDGFTFSDSRNTLAVEDRAHRGLFHELVYTDFVKNVTISLPDHTLEALREKARSSGKSLNAWLGEILKREATTDQAWMEDFERVTSACADQVSGNWRWNREEVHEERIPRH